MPQPVKHIRHNTGRLYTKVGQVVWIRIDRDNKQAIFADLSRGVDGCVQLYRVIASDREIVEHVMHCYDHMQYERDSSWGFAMSSDDPNGATKLELKFAAAHPERVAGRSTWEEEQC